MIHTKVWKDEYFGNLNRVEKLLFIYLLTNDKANICGIYELSDREIKFDLDITEPELQEAKERFQKDGKFIFLNSWVRVVNYEKYNPYTGSKNESAKDSELNLCPIELKEYPIDTLSTISDSLTNHISISNTNTNKGVVRGKHQYQENEVPDDVCTEIANKYRLQEKDVIKKRDDMALWSMSNGEKKADWKATLMNWVRKDIDNGLLKKKPEFEYIIPKDNPTGLEKLSKIREGIGRAI